MSVDSELLVNVLTPRVQTSNIVGSAIDVNDRGDAVIVFSGKGPLDDHGIFARRFLSSGSSSEVVQVNQTTREDQLDPTVAIDASGNYSIAWWGRGKDPRGLADQQGIFARSYRSDGQPRSDETLINTTIGGVQKQPDISMAPDGRAVIVWSGAGPDDPDGIYFQRLDAAGRPVGLQTRANQGARGEQSFPSVAMADDGSFILSWSSRHQDGDGWGIFYRQFNSDGTPRGSEQLASSQSIGSQFRSRIGSDAHGNFAIAWAGYSVSSDWDVWFRRFDSSGLPQGLERRVNQNAQGLQQDPDLAMASDGRFVISWTSGQPTSGSSSGWDVFAKLYDALGNEITGDHPIQPTGGSENAGHQQFTAVAIGAGPDLFASWSGRGGADHGGVWLSQPSMDLRPILPAIQPLAIPEQQFATIDIPTIAAFSGQRIGLRLDPSDQPIGMVVDPFQKRLLWTPSEADGPGLHFATVIAYDLDNPRQTTSQRIAIHVDEVNRAPIIAPIANIAVDEFQTVTVRAMASDPDLPANQVRYSLASDRGLLDAGMSIDPNSGVFSWTTTEQHGRNEPYSVTVVATDNGTPPKSASTTFLITVRELDEPPRLQPIAETTIDEGSFFSRTWIGIDPDDPNPRWRFFPVQNLPSGMQLDSSSGLLSWTPTELQGPGNYSIVVGLENLNQPSATATQTLLIHVREVNRPPSLAPLPSLSGAVGHAFAFTAQATDDDIPINHLRYTLEESPDNSASIDPTSGRITWTASSSGSFRFTVRVTDDGTPPLSDFETTTITIGEAASKNPKLHTIPDQSIDEEKPFQFQLVADAAYQGQTIRFRLLANPAGVKLDPVTGILSWTPTEQQGPSFNEIQVTAFDRDHEELQDHLAFHIQVNEVNKAPSFAAPDPIQVVEGPRITQQLIARDADFPANKLRYSIVGSAPLGFVIDPNSGLATWQTTEADGPGVYAIHIRVSDDGNPALSDQQTMTIAIRESNSSPVFPKIEDQTIDEQVPFALDLAATDFDLPKQTLTYKLDSQSILAGLQIDARTGRLSWLPSEEQGPSDRIVTVTAQDDGSPIQESNQTFRIRVREVNRPPRLQPIPNQTVAPGETLSIPLFATDEDRPTNGLAITFSPNLPPGATWDDRSSVLTWKVPVDAEPQSYSIRASVADDGVPSLDDHQDFHIDVLPKTVEIVEAQRFVTPFVQPITIQPGTQSLEFRLRDLKFDNTDRESMNDALELALLDSQDRPMTSIIAPGRDAFFNWTEGETPKISRGAKFDSLNGLISVDVSQLDSGSQLRFIARLVNNDRDDNSRATFDANIRQRTSGISKELGTLSEPAPIAQTRSPLTTEQALHRLTDRTRDMEITYSLTTFDTDSRLTTGVVTLANTSSHALRGPLLLAISNIDQPDVRVVDQAGFLPPSSSGLGTGLGTGLRGAPFYDLTPLLTEFALSDRAVPVFPAGESLTLQLRFENRAHARFRYEIHLLGTINSPPSFPSGTENNASGGTIKEGSIVTVHSGNSMAIPVPSLDADQDAITYSIESGPPGLTIDPDLGILQWTTSGVPSSSYSVVLSATDPFHASDQIAFTVMVIDPTTDNRPPRFVSTPLVDAYVGQPFRYESRGIDSDFDTLEYRLTEGPSRVSIVKETGDVVWMPTIEDVGSVSQVAIEVSDGHGGSAIQKFHIVVHSDPDNHPPMFVTEPDRNFTIPRWDVGPSLGPVSPASVIELLPRGTSQTREISLQIPPNLELPTADIALVVDESGSMHEQAWIADVIQKLDEALQKQGVFDNRFAVVGFGGKDPSPRTILDTPDFDLLDYGPSGGLIRRIALKNDGRPIQLEATQPGHHTFALVKHLDSTSSSNGSADGGTPSPIPYLDYFFQTAAGTKLSVVPRGLGLQQGTLNANQSLDLSFTYESGNLLYLDGLEGNLVQFQILDPDGNLVVERDSLLSDSGPIAIHRSGTYQIHLQSLEATSFAFNLIDLKRDAQLAKLGDSLTGTLQNPESVEAYRIPAVAGQSVLVDRFFRTNNNPFGSEVIEDSSVDWIAPDGSSIGSPSSVNVRPSERPTLDIEPIRIAQDGFYTLLVRKGPKANGSAISYRLRIEDLVSNSKAIRIGEVVDSATPEPSASSLYAIDLQADQNISMDVTSRSGGAAKYRWMDSQGLPIATGLLEIGTAVFQSPIRYSGKYYLMIEGVAANTQAAQYRFSLKGSNASTSSGSQATTIALTKRIEADFSPDQGPDTYRMTLSGNQRLVVQANAPSGTMKVIAPTGGVILANDFASNSQDLPFVRAFDTTIAGEYHIEFSGVSSFHYSLQFDTPNRSLDASTKTIDGTLQPADAFVSFDWNASAGEVMVLNRPDQSSPFADAKLASSRALTLQSSGGTEDGYFGLHYAMEHLPFREHVPKHVLLITDEDRDIITSDNPGSILSLLVSHGIQLHSVVKGDFEVGREGRALGLVQAPNGYRGYFPDGQGGFRQAIQPNYALRDPFGTTEQDYVDLTWDDQGSNWSINTLRADSANSELDRSSFTGALVSEIASRSGAQVELALRVTDPSAPVKLGSAHFANGKIVFPATLHGDGDAWNFDFEFYNRKHPQTVYGIVPAAIAAGYRYDPLAVDIDGDPIHYSLASSVATVAQGQAGSVTFDPFAPSLTWNPTLPGLYPFTLSAMDDHGGEDLQVFTVRVDQANATNRNPVLSSIRDRTIAALDTIQIPLQASDADGDALTFQLLDGQSFGSLPNGIEIDPSTGVLSWQPSRIQIGSHSMSVRVVDGRGGSDVRSFKIDVTVPRVTDHPRPILLSQPEESVFARERFRYDLDATSPDDQPLRYTIAIGPSGMAIDRSTGVVVWQTKDEDVGSHDVILRVADTSGGVTLQAFQIFVKENAPTRIVSVPPDKVDLGASMSYQVEAQSRLPQDAFRFELILGPDDAAIDTKSGKLTWVPKAIGDNLFEVRATSQLGELDTQRFTLRVLDNSVNHAPTLDDLARTSIPVSRPFVWQVPGSDVDLDPLQFELLSGPRGMSLSRDGQLSWTPEPTQVTTPGSAPHSFRIHVTDARGGTAARSYSLRVDRDFENQAPVLKGDPRSIAVVGRTYQSLFQATDSDGDFLIWTLVDGPQGMRVDARGLVDWTPTASQLGKQTVTLRVADIYGGWDATTWTIDVRATNAPPSLTGNPPSRHRVDKPYETTFAASDPEGDAVVFKLLNGPDDAILDPKSGVLRWTPHRQGNFAFTIAARDPLGDFSSMSFQVVVDRIGGNLPPHFESVEAGSAEVGSRYRVQFPATDPDDDALEYSVQSGPNGMSIDPQGWVEWQVPMDLVGRTVHVQLVASDPLKQTASKGLELPILAPNRSPVFEIEPKLVWVAGQTFVELLAASDPDNDPLHFAIIAAPAAMTFDALTQELRWRTTSKDIGTHSITVSVTDGRIAQPVTKTWTVNIVEDQLPPEIRVEVSNVNPNVGEDVFVGFDTRDNVFVDFAELKIGDEVIDLDRFGQGVFHLDHPGNYQLTGTAIDSSGNKGTKSISIRVRDPNNAAPSIQFVSPNGTTPITSPVDVLANIIDRDLDLTHVALEIQRVEDGKPGSGTWRELRTLTAPPGKTLSNFFSSSVGLLDSTSLANGNYRLRITAEDLAFNRSVSTQAITIDGKLKMGSFQIGFTDLTIPVAGIPITILRSYDSFQADHSDELGYGWQLNVAKAEVHVVQGTLGELGSGRFEGFVDGTRVIARLPDGRTEGFTFQAQPGNQAFGIVFDWRPGFVPDRNNTTRLELDPIELIKFNSEYQTLDGVTYNPADPRIGGVYRLKDASQLTHHIPADLGKSVRISDVNDNSLIFHEDGIESTRGRSVLFERDQLGRITRVVDPKGNAIVYRYSTDGDLLSVTDRMGNKTQFSYVAGLDHYLHSIIDPFGEVAVEANYSFDSRRLQSLVDVDGARTGVTNDLTTLTTTQTLPSGATTLVQFDRNGNPIRAVDRQGIETRTSYTESAPYLPISERLVVGTLDTDPQGDDQVTQRTFNLSGQLISQTDPRGNVTRYFYRPDGSLASTVDPSGIATYSNYDAKGRLIAAGSSAATGSEIRYDSQGNPVQIVTNASAGEAGDFGGQGGHGGNGSGSGATSSGVTTRFTYDRFGDIVSLTDHNGSVQNMSYDENGNKTLTSTVWRDPLNERNRVEIRQSQGINANDLADRGGSPQGERTTVFDPLNRPIKTVDQRGLATETRMDVRGLLIETRNETLQHQSDGTTKRVWMISRTVFDQNGNATDATDPLAEGSPIQEQTATHTEYDAAGRVVSTARVRGMEIEIVGSPGHWRSRVKSPGTIVDQSSTVYDALGRVVRTSLSDGSVSETAYDRWGQVIEARNQTRNELGELQWRVKRTIYDSLGRVVLATSPYLVSANTRLGTGESPSTFATRTEYDERGHARRLVRLADVVVTIDGGGIRVVEPGRVLAESISEYDNNGRMVRRRSEDGQVTDFLYDGRGRKIGSVGARQTAESVGLGKQYPNQFVRLRTEMSFDAVGQQSAETTGIIQVEDSQGKVIAIDRAQARTTQFVFDELGRLRKTTNPDGTSTAREYNAQGLVTAEIDPLGRRKEIQFDASGHATSISLPAVPLPNNPAQLARPRWEYQYNAKGYVVSIRDNLAQLPSGEVLADHDGKPGDDSRTTRFEYDGAGHLTKRILPDGSTETFTFDAQGREVLHVSFEGTLRQTIYDDSPGAAPGVAREDFFVNRSQFDGGKGTPEESIVYTYDGFGRSVAKELWVRNSDGQLTLSDRWTTEYDGQGRIVRQKSPSGNLNYAYDELGRKTRMFTGHASSFALDLASPESDTRYAYDSLSRLIGVETVVRDGQAVDSDTNLAGNQSESTRYHYDVIGRLDYTELPGGIIESNTYDSMDRVVSIEHFSSDTNNLDRSDNPKLDAISYRYQSDGRRVGSTEQFYFDHDNNSSTPRVAKVNNFTWRYDSAGRLIEEGIDHMERAADRTDRIVWDLVGNQVRRTIDFADPSMVDQAIVSLYDQNDRIQSESIDEGNNGSVDRLTTTAWSGTHQDSSRIVDGMGAKVATYSYSVRGPMNGVLNETSDTSGKTTARTRIDYQLDPEGNRVGSSEITDGNLATNAIEPVAGNRTDYWIDVHNPTGYVQTILEQVRNPAGKTIQRTNFSYGLDELSQTRSIFHAQTGILESITASTFAHDAHGNVRAIYDSTQHAYQVYSYLGFGSLLSIHSSNGDAKAILDQVVAGQRTRNLESLAMTNLLYSGEAFDSRIGMRYLRARWQSGSRFTSIDPFAGDRMNPWSLNKYAYTNGDPILHSDPSGMMDIVSTMQTIAIHTTTFAISFFGAAFSESFMQPIVPLPRHQVDRAWIFAKLTSASYKAAEENDEWPTLESQYHFKRDNIYFDLSSGYRAVSFHNTFSGFRVMSYAGTDDKPDVATDAWQGLLGGSKQYVQAVSDVVTDETLSGPISEFTGHSLGGGLASTASIVYDRHATTFNAAGVHPTTVEMFGKTLDNADLLIMAYRVRGEALSTIQGGNPLWIAMALISKNPALGIYGLAGFLMPNGVGIPYWLRETSVDIISRHKMFDVFEGLKKARQ